MNGRPIFINSLQTHSAEVISWPWKNNLCHQFAPAFSHQTPETWKAAGLAAHAAKKRSCDTVVRNRQHLKIYNTSDRKLGHWFVVAGANCSAEDSCSGRRGNAAANLGSGESWRSTRAPTGSERRATCCTFPVVALERWPLDQIVFDSSERRPDQTSTSAKLKWEGRHISTHVPRLCFRVLVWNVR